MTLAVWAAVSIVAGSILTSFHQPFTLPNGSISSVALTAPAHTWRVLHLLAADCGCSRKVFEYLAGRAPLQNITEEIVFIGPAEKFPSRDRLVALGFRVNTVRPEDVQQYGLTGVPLLVFISPKDEIAYMGGYGAGSYRDAAIWSELQAGSVASPLPVLGCAVGNRLKRELDPLSWKYAREKVEGRLPLLSITEKNQ